jgi:hypothetical protein
MIQPAPHWSPSSLSTACEQGNPDLSIAAIREDRILDEAHATGGDVRRLADLFGLSMQVGTRYIGAVSHRDLDGNDQS